MTSPRTEAEILKQDTRGRVRVSAERREALLEEFEKSALSGAKFARLAGIKYATFANWVARRRRQRTAASGGESASSEGARPIRLFEAVVETDRGGAARVGVAVEGLVVELPGGSRALVGSPVQLQMAAELVVLVAQGMRSRC
jgi:hypothetical protein